MSKTSSELASELNSDLYARNIGPQVASASLPPVPASTRRDYRYFSKPATPTIVATYGVSSEGNGVPESSYSVYAQNIHNDSTVKAINTPLSKCISGASYMPNSHSDLYSNASAPPTSHTGAYGFTGQVIQGISSQTETALPGTRVFGNHTRQQTKNLGER